MKKGRRVIFLLVVLLMGGVLLSPFFFVKQRELPKGAHCRLGPYDAARHEVRLLQDCTAYDEAAGERVIHQEIFDAVLQQIRQARTLIYADFFLWNPWQGAVPETYRSVAEELAQALIAQKQAYPDLAVLVLTDPINRCYGAQEPAFFKKMADAGIAVVFTDLNQMRDSNPLYSFPARFYGGLLGRISGVNHWLDQPRLKNVFSAEAGEMSARQWLTLLHFKANHRKLLISDAPDGAYSLLVTSMNPANGSAAHDNAALQVTGPLAVKVLQQELDVVRWSAEQANNVLNAVALTEVLPVLEQIAQGAEAPLEERPDAAVYWLSEAAICDQIVMMLQQVEPGDLVRVAMFYLSDQKVIAALKTALLQKAEIRLLLDPNKDAFGRTKNGIPNRPVAESLLAFSRQNDTKLAVRWAATHGEQFHTKAMSITSSRLPYRQLLLGSANWTRRNLQDYNLEADLYLRDVPGPTDRFDAAFDQAWFNTGSYVYSDDYSAFAEKNWARWWKQRAYYIQEKTGLCTF